jgi:hypothetical protein
MNKLSKESVKEAVEILCKEMELSMHLAKYPQDRWKHESQPIEISKLISTAEFHNKRWQEIKSVIDYLVLSVEEVSKPSFPADTVQKGEG